MNKKNKRIQTMDEEIANSITHGIGTGLSIAALVILVTLASQNGDPWKVVGFSIYGASLFLLYLISTLYHGFTNMNVKKFFRVLDHSAIFLLIAGTYTPITLTVMRGPWGWTLFGIVWGLAILGILLKTIMFGKFEKLSVVLYLLMGWIVVIAIKPLIIMLPFTSLMWLAIGGVLYTAGVIFYAWQRLPYHHVIWHIFVLGGSISHFFGMLYL
ncbi:MAG: hemolysin III family protein [Candidatus Marinimicrobia bacterium]|nr:hemolysin III family protein [Candidatus Neomarinimicrobiota bacterium]